MLNSRRIWFSFVLMGIVVLASACANGLNTQPQQPTDQAASINTRTPIKHLIVIIGENHTFDNTFATFQPSNGQTINNLLSEGIVTQSGGLGPKASLAAQQQATNNTTFSLNPHQTGPYQTLPQPNTTTALGLPQNQPDGRFPQNLPNGPYQITKYIPYQNSYSGDPIHRFYQMWQQLGNGKNNLFTWVHQTAGDDNGETTPAAIYQGALEMGYYNMSQGDVPQFKFIGDNYAISDNYHQAIMGGTGANHIVLGTGDVAYYTNDQGQPAMPPLNQIENPNPKPGSNNNYKQDGYSGGSYTNCSDMSQPGVTPIMSYLHSLSYQPFRGGDCAPGAYYLLNNYSPGYTASGQRTTSTPFAIPPQILPTIADSLSAHHISWKYYGQGYNNGNPTKEFCGICDPFQYATSIMTTNLKQNIQDFSQFQADVNHDTLPAVSFIKPEASNDGHPGYSSLSKFESFATSITNQVISKPDLFKQTAILITMDEGGGYYDSGYVQPLSYFGDGTRIPMLVVSPYAKQGFVDHTYTDHASVLKFIERNWNLQPLSSRSFDNLPNPVASASNAYVPTNGPAIGDLMQFFDFSHLRTATPSLPNAAP